jgi:hypothetical protein
VREQPQDHLQAAPPGAQHRVARVRVDFVGGQLGGDGVACLDGRGHSRAGPGDLRLQAGDAVVLDRGRGGGGAGDRGGEVTLGGVQGLLGVADSGVGFAAGRVAGLVLAVISAR